IGEGAEAGPGRGYDVAHAGAGVAVLPELPDAGIEELFAERWSWHHPSIRTYVLKSSDLVSRSCGSGLRSNSNTSGDEARTLARLRLQRAHSREQLAHALLRNATRDEHEAARAVRIGPGGELDRRMAEMLHALNQDRPAAAGDVEETLYAQQIGSAHRDQRLHAARECVEWNRRRFGEDKARDAVAV